MHAEASPKEQVGERARHRAQAVRVRKAGASAHVQERTQRRAPKAQVVVHCSFIHIVFCVYLFRVYFCDSLLSDRFYVPTILEV